LDAARGAAISATVQDGSVRHYPQPGAAQRKRRAMKPVAVKPVNCKNTAVFERCFDMNGKIRQFVSFDWAMKKLLRSRANSGVLNGFLSELLDEDITITDLLESEGGRPYAEAKDKLDYLKLSRQERAEYEAYEKRLRIEASEIAFSIKRFEKAEEELKEERRQKEEERRQKELLVAKLKSTGMSAEEIQKLLQS